jgi:type VI secretion system protein ImpA
MKIAIDSLLQPISPEAPAGEDLSFSTELDSIQEARREEDASLDQGDWVRDIKEADWNKVITQATDILRTRSKDLRVAGWLTEAMGKSGGFAGLADGLAFVEQFLERFWPTLYPQLDGEDYEERVGSLTWLIQRSVAIIRSMPLSQAPVGAFSWAAHESARALQAQMDRSPDDADTLAADNLTLATFRAACGATPKPFYESLHADFGKLRAAAKSFETSVDARLGANGPAFSPLREALDDVGMLVERLAREAGVLAAAKGTTADAPADLDNNDDDTVVTTQSGPIRTRAQALRQLRQVAEFFRRTEPHSPVAYLADKAAGWGEIPLHKWLKQVIKDAGALSHLEELLGTESSAKTSDEDAN